MLRGKVLFAYLVVCVLWGSTYIAIRIGDRTLPPVLFAGLRFVIAGMILFVASLAAGQRLPARPRDWRDLSIVGLLLLSGNTCVVVAERFTPAGVASVFVVMAVVWTAFFETIVAGRASGLSARLVVGLALGLLGTVVLVGFTPEELAHADWRGPAILTCGTLLWAAGAVYYRHSHPQAGTYLGAAVEMLAAGVVITSLGFALGEGPRFHLTRSGAGALVYLIVFGSLVGYSAYNYALTHASATVVGTYTYVNPVIAVLLGWGLLNEQIDARVIAGMVIVLAAVVVTQLSWRPAFLRRPAAGD
ncbi:MAG TPA: EamA family transporter [Gemmatimonadaceae bacterium]|nr:EamA family transporter [Gemmatimonadaceae bacterium]